MMILQITNRKRTLKPNSNARSAEIYEEQKEGAAILWKISINIDLKMPQGNQLALIVRF